MEKRLKPHDELISRKEAIKSLRELRESFCKFGQLEYEDHRFLMGLECAEMRIAGLPYIYKKSSEKK